MLWTDLFLYLVIIVLMLTLLHFKNYFKAVYLGFRIGGPPALPILGNVFYVNDSDKLNTLAEQVTELYTPCMRFWLSIVPFFVIYEPKHLQLILGTNKYTTKNMFYTFLHNLLGDGLITNSGEKWKQHRKLIQPYFHINVLKVYFEAFYKASKALLHDLQDNCDINMAKFANKFVLDVLHDAILGIPSNKEEKSPYRSGEVYMHYRVSKPWLLLNSFFKRTDLSKKEERQQSVLQSYTRKTLETKKKEFFNKSQPSNLMEMMIEISKENPEFTDDDIVNEVCTFMLAGQDSVGVALTFSLYFLASNQEIQEKVIDELKSILKDTDRPITFEDTCEMKYLEQCIKETMRLCPSVPIISRKLTEDFPLGKYVLPKGSNLFISPYMTHRLPHVFPNPLKFDPERFSVENKAKIHPFAYLPFSAGPRNCIGYKFALIELKTIISQILINYHLSLTPGCEKLNLVYRITLKAKNGIRLRLKKRNA